MSGEKANGDKASPFWAAALDPARPGDVKRYKDRVKPVAPGFSVPLGAGAPMLGFHGVDYVGARAFRWLGPEPRGLLFVGRLEAGVGALVVALAREIPAGVGAPRVLWNGAPLALERAAPPPGAVVAFRAPLPAGAPAREVSTLEIRLERTVPDPDRRPATRLVGIALSAVVFVGAAA